MPKSLMLKRLASYNAPGACEKAAETEAAEAEAAEAEEAAEAAEAGPLKGASLQGPHTVPEGVDRG